MSDEVDVTLEQAEWLDDEMAAAKELKWHEVQRWTKEDRARLRLRREKREARRQSRKERKP